MSPSPAYALYRRDRCSPAPSSRSRSLTLPLDEDADDETGQETDNEKFMSIHKTTGHAHRVNTTSKVITRNIQKRKSKASQVLKPVSSRISKQSPNKRSLQRRIPKQQYEAKQLGEKTGSSPKIRQDKPQESNLTSPATLPTHQVDQPGDLNNRQNSRGRQVRPHRASIALPPHSTQPATRRRAIALQNKKINPESPTSSIARKRRRRNSAQGAWHSKQENRQRSPQEYKTKSGRVSKRPERLGFTW